MEQSRTPFVDDFYCNVDETHPRTKIRGIDKDGNRFIEITQKYGCTRRWRYAFMCITLAVLTALELPGFRWCCDMLFVYTVHRPACPFCVPVQSRNNITMIVCTFLTVGG